MFSFLFLNYLYFIFIVHCSDLSWNQDYAFWIQMNDINIYIASLDGSSKLPTALTGQAISSPRSLATDWLGEKIYWSDSDTSEASFSLSYLMGFGVA